MEAPSDIQSTDRAGGQPGEAPCGAQAVPLVAGALRSCFIAAAYPAFMSTWLLSVLDCAAPMLTRWAFRPSLCGTLELTRCCPLTAF